MTQRNIQVVDLFIIGGGVNGCGIARDAAGRGFSVTLAEMNDLASATSSSSTKLFHGGLRYLEFFEFRLVQESLKEREVLLKAVPHISWPMRFVLPYHSDMRFAEATPTSRLLSLFMPWMQGKRPAWLIRLGLWLYDHLGKNQILPGTATLDLERDELTNPLQSQFTKAFEYSDCWVEDARLVVLNAKDAQSRGATILKRSKVLSAAHDKGLWQIEVGKPDGTIETHQARMLINAGGPWVAEVIKDTLSLEAKEKVRLVRGSHIVTKRLYDHEKCYFFQGNDGRIIFAIPYEEDYTLIGTTEVEHEDVSLEPVCSDKEVDYLIHFINGYMRRPIARRDIVWTYSGVRPLYDDGERSATAATRDYVLRLDTSAGAPLLNVFGGKITTYRKLAESALEVVDQALSSKTKAWTAGVSLPGGDFAVGDVYELQQALAAQLPFFDDFTIRRLIRQFGTEAKAIFSKADRLEDLGKHFGQGITARELDWLVHHEWVDCAEDFLWRRSKMGLRVSDDQKAEIERYITDICNGV